MPAQKQKSDSPFTKILRGTQETVFKSKAAIIASGKRMLSSKAKADATHQLLIAGDVDIQGGTTSLGGHSLPTRLPAITRVEKMVDDADYTIHETQAESPHSPAAYTVSQQQTQPEPPAQLVPFHQTPDGDANTSSYQGAGPGMPPQHTAFANFPGIRSQTDPAVMNMLSAILSIVQGLSTSVQTLTSDVASLRISSAATAASVEVLRADTASAFATQTATIQKITQDVKLIHDSSDQNAVTIQKLVVSQIAADKNVEQRLEVLDRTNRRHIEQDIMITIPKTISSDQTKVKAAELGSMTETEVADMLGVQPGMGCRILEKKAPKPAAGRQPAWRHGDPCDRMRIWVQDRSVVEDIVGKKANRQAFTQRTGFMAQRQLTELELDNKTFLQANVMPLMHGSLNRKAWWTRAAVTWYVEAKQTFANLYRSDVPLEFDEMVIRSIVEDIEARLPDNSVAGNIAGLPAAPADAPQAARAAESAAPDHNMATA